MVYPICIRSIFCLFSKVEQAIVVRNFDAQFFKLLVLIDLLIMNMKL